MNRIQIWGSFIILSHDMTNFVCMVQHFRSEVPTILIITGILALLGHKSMLTRNDGLIMCWYRTISNLTMAQLVIPHLLHFLIVKIILIFEGEFRVLFDLVRHLFRFETDYIEFAVLLTIDLPLIKCQTIVPII